jgi:Undecaprenyl-phosphate glucose phosphotransferase
MTFGLALLARLVLARRMSAWKASGRLREVIAIIGTGKAADRLRDEITQRDGSAVEVVGVYDDRQTRKASDCAEPDGTIGDLLELGKHRHIDRILVTLPWSAEKRLLEILRTLKNLAVEVALAPPDFGLRLPQRSIDFLSDLPIMVVADRPLRRWSLLLKMAEDKLLAALLLVFLGPLMALTALAIRIDSPGPILFRQERVGWNNKTFWVFKFRTMTWDPGASRQIQQTRRNDSRVTRLGGFLRKTSLDELPQILNVLRGEMSLVGPRPHAVSMRTENMLGDEIVAEYANRHRVRPGITGWAQVNGYRGATEHADQLRKRVEFDLHYIENWSVLFDVKILVMTIITVFARENAF